MVYVKQSSLGGLIYNGREYQTHDSVVKEVIKDQTALMYKNIKSTFSGGRVFAGDRLKLKDFQKGADDEANS